MRKATISFVLSVRPHGATCLPLDGLSRNFIFEDFRIADPKIQVSLKSDKNKGDFTLRPIYIFIIFVLRMRNISDNSCRENQNTHFLFSDFFRISFIVYENVEKYCRAGQTTDDNMVHAHCMQDT